MSGAVFGGFGGRGTRSKGHGWGIGSGLGLVLGLAERSRDVDGCGAIARAGYQSLSSGECLMNSTVICFAGAL